MRALILALSLTACSSTVRVQVPPSPAVSLEAEPMAVVARDRECRDIARSLVDELHRVGLKVDPRSDVRLVLHACGEDFRWTVFQRPDARRRARLEGRAHAMVTVTAAGAVEARLVGTSRGASDGAWQRGGLGGFLTMRRSVSADLAASVASDLAQQVSPVSRQARRRVYPRAQEGTSRQLHTLAVRAEQAGELADAWRLALAAYEERPSSRSARYVATLARRLSPDPSQTSAHHPD